jgi:hypothetical protein
MTHQSKWHFQLIKNRDSDHLSLSIVFIDEHGGTHRSGRPAWIEGRSIGEVKNLLRKMMSDVDQHGILEIEGEDDAH